MVEFRTRNLKPFLDNAILVEVLHTKHWKQNLKHDLFKSIIRTARQIVNRTKTGNQSKLLSKLVPYMLSCKSLYF